MVDVNELELEALEAEGDPDEGRYTDPFEGDRETSEDDFLSDDGDALPEEVQAELEALASAELDDGTAALESALAETQRELARQRTLTQQAIARYRDALLAAEPELPPDLVTGDTLEEVEASAASARATVQRIRERVASEGAAHPGQPERPRGFPVGAPARRSDRADRGRMSPHDKIAAGLQERMV